MKQKPHWVTLPKRIAAFSLAMLLSACIFSVEPVLDETNSVAGKDSTEFQAFLEAWRLVYSEADGSLMEGFVFEANGDFVEAEAFRVTPLSDTSLLVQQQLEPPLDNQLAPQKGECIADHCFIYYTVKLTEPWWPSYCIGDSDEEFTEPLVAIAAQHGVTLTIINDGEKTSRDYGISGPKENLLPYLLAQFADGPMICTDDHGKTPLHEAYLFDDVPGRITELVELGAAPNARMGGEGCEGSTPLHEIVDSGISFETISELVSVGADLNATMCDGQSPLHLAAASGLSPYIIEAFLDLGADGGLKTKDGKTPFELMPPPSADDPASSSTEYKKAYKRLEQAQND
ncbi:ankyrin repeat domain-containing protein [Actibacterium pelagium]|uniref:Ankyrin repeats (3 copies) n=1 Tax=Actibacterium pelagium TaxID=2029103 RepID=A0A917A9Z9_9RHOB|nr:ankyrin repeat domain-containing protein [Actibacterium pelagium]GGE36774.1 hypothetical protein GCM10011517_00610 [Actibacterium pelagium]